MTRPPTYLLTGEETLCVNPLSWKPDAAKVLPLSAHHVLNPCFLITRLPAPLLVHRVIVILALFPAR